MRILIPFALVLSLTASACRLQNRPEPRSTAAELGQAAVGSPVRFTPGRLRVVTFNVAMKSARGDGGSHGIATSAGIACPTCR